MASSKRVLQRARDSEAVPAFLAMVVRNAMEDFHHEHLTDKQMQELNPIIRNAIHTGLQAISHRDTSEGARSYIDFQVRMIPPYWEPAELLADFVGVVKKLDVPGEGGQSI